ncbi:hypothetical protein [Halorubellus litoreus]|uniref:Uncharacterized protein n=1 Tax=Halorubellus litoreus TaxID=755308 RepID=A0ABD5VHM9_9EURY
MNKTSILLLGLFVVAAVPTAPGASGINETGTDNNVVQESEPEEVIERSFRSRGTEYLISVNLSNHTVRVKADHFADNQTSVGFALYLNDKQLTNQMWTLSQGQTKKYKKKIINDYYAGDIYRNLTIYTRNEVASIAYNFTVPRKYNGRYLRPTIKKIDFERLNHTAGRLTITVRSDSEYYYPIYYQIWTPGVQADYIEVRPTEGENITRSSIILPIDKGESVEGEIRAHAMLLNKTGPLSTQVEFYGRPGNVQFQRVPFEPLQLERVTEHTYVNESVSENGAFGVSDQAFRRVLGGVGVLLLLIVVVGVLLGRRRRRV